MHCSWLLDNKEPCGEYTAIYSLISAHAYIYIHRHANMHDQGAFTIALNLRNRGMDPQLNDLTTNH